MKGVFLDIETTGLDFVDHVPLDIGVIIVDLHTMSCIATYSSLIRCYSVHWAKADKQALEVNGFNIDNHIDTKEHTQVGQELLSFFLEHDIVRGQAVFICQNPSFDRIFLDKLLPQRKMNEFNLPYHWLDLASMYWIKAMDLTKPVNGHSLSRHSPISLSKDTIASMLGIHPEGKPHKAINGASHLFDCYKALVEASFPLKV